MKPALPLLSFAVLLAALVASSVPLDLKLFISAAHASDHRSSRTLRQQLVHTTTDGYTMDACRTDSDCVGDRECLTSEDNSIVSCHNNSTSCFCVPENGNFQRCTNSSQCETGEICAVRTSDSTMIICVSEDFVNALDLFTPYDENNPPSPSPSPPPTITPDPSPSRSSSPTQGGCDCMLTFEDDCTTDGDCIGDRNCYTVENDQLVKCAGVKCFCRPATLQLCESSADCVRGEVCVGSDHNEKTFCISRKEEIEDDTYTEVGPPPSKTPKASTAPPPPGLEPPACVDARALGHMRTEELVYETHRWQSVLCDANDSCATAGHIVMYEGRAMMMKTYCALAGCEKRRLLVNSPRYKRGLVVESKTEGLMYTVFAARYETVLEERVLHAAVRIGL